MPSPHKYLELVGDSAYENLKLQSIKNGSCRMAHFN